LKVETQEILEEKLRNEAFEHFRIDPENDCML